MCSSQARSHEYMLAGGNFKRLQVLTERLQGLLPICFDEALSFFPFSE